MATSPTNYDPKVLFDPKILTTTATDTEYTAPNGGSDSGVRIEAIYVVNYGSDTAKFRVRHTPSGGSALQMPDMGIPSDGVVYPVEIIRFLDKGDKLEFWSDTATTLKFWMTGITMDEA